MKRSKSLNLLIAILILSGINLLSGCSNDESLNPAGSNSNSTDNLTLSIISDENVTDANEIVITEAKALVGEVELETEPSSQSINLQISPFVVNLNSVSVAELASVTIPSGNYNKIKFQLHKPEDNETPPDPEFKEGASGNQRFSIIVKGTFNGNPFVFKSRKSTNVVIFLNNLLSIAEGSRNLTLVVNPSVWFKNGNNVLDPSDSSNQDIIDDNIKSSFKRAFRDDNRDGRPDDN